MRRSHTLRVSSVGLWWFSVERKLSYRVAICFFLSPRRSALLERQFLDVADCLATRLAFLPTEVIALEHASAASQSSALYAVYLSALSLGDTISGLLTAPLVHSLGLDDVGLQMRGDLSLGRRAISPA